MALPVPLLLHDAGKNVVQGGPQIGTIFVRLNFTDFQNYFAVRIRRKKCNNTITKDPTTSQVCRYTTL